MSSTFTPQNQPWGNWQGSHQPVYTPPALPPPPPVSGPLHPSSFPVLGASYGAQSASPVSANGASNWQGHMATSPGIQASPGGYVPVGLNNPRSQNQSGVATPTTQQGATNTQDPAIVNQEEDLIDKILASEPEMEPWLEELKALDDEFNSKKPGGGPTGMSLLIPICINDFTDML